MVTLIKNAEVWYHNHFEQKSVIIKQDKLYFANNISDTASFDKIMDATGTYLLPGVIDCHAHSTMVCGRSHMADFFASNENELTIDAVVNVERMVRNGITTIRDCGGRHLETLAVRNYINQGKIVGPRMLCSGTPLKVIGGHEPGVNFTGPYEARAKVREFLHEGTDFIKAMVTGGLGKAGEDPGCVEMEQEELSAIVSEAHKHGKKVACHCHSREGMERIVIAGADSIDHCTYLDSEINEKIIQKGIFIVPTFLPYMYYALLGEAENQLMDTVLAARGIVEEKKRRFTQAYQQGVNIAFGRDSGGFMMDQGEFVQEMLYMQDAGMTSTDIIVSATENAAKLCGVFNETGSIENGKSADLILLSKSPLENLCAYRDNLIGVYARGIYFTKSEGEN